MACVVKVSNYPEKYVKLVLLLVGYDLHGRSVVLPCTCGGFIWHVYLLGQNVWEPWHYDVLLEKRRTKMIVKR